MSDVLVEIPEDLKRSGRRAGYVIAIVVNLALLVVVQNILDWGWLPFLTTDFAQVVPWVSMSLIVTAAMNVVYLVDERPDVKSWGQIGINLIGLLITYRVWQVFPFDFSASQFDWTVLTRVVLILGMVGSGIGLLTEATKLASRHIDERR
jgi:hypothetical protein